MADEVRKSVGLSLGTTGISIAVVHQRKNDLPEIMAFDRVPCRFLRDGLVVNLEALQEAVATCKKNIACLVKASYADTTVNLCGVSLRMESGTSTQVWKRKTEIKKKHLFELHGSRLYLEDDAWRLVHYYPTSYDLDNQSGLASPVGMIGKTLSAHMKQLYVPVVVIDSILHAVSRCGFTVTNIVPDPLASFEALVTEDEKEMGMWLLDIGGRVMQTAFLKGQQVQILTPLQVGSDSVTSDIAIGLNTTTRDAERIKILYGCALTELASDEILVHIPPLGGGHAENPASQHRLAEIIKSRMEELIEMAAASIIEQTGTERISPGIIITGGGSLLPGTLELAAKYLGMPVIEGHLRNVARVTDLPPVPLCASAVGLAIYGGNSPRVLNWNLHGETVWKRFYKNIIRWFGGNG